eukprot:2656036-Rhodomonas_salina.1
MREESAARYRLGVPLGLLVAAFRPKSNAINHLCSTVCTRNAASCISFRSIPLVTTGNGPDSSGVCDTEYWECYVLWAENSTGIATCYGSRLAAYQEQLPHP